MRKLLIVLACFTLVFTACGKQEQKQEAPKEEPKAVTEVDIGSPDDWIRTEASSEMMDTFSMLGVEGVEKATVIKISEDSQQDYDLMECTSEESAKQLLALYKEQFTQMDDPLDVKETDDSVIVSSGFSMDSPESYTIQVAARNGNSVLVTTEFGMVANPNVTVTGGTPASAETKAEIYKVFEELGFKLS